ncbi:MAG TPA: flippase activity-associated protein Agl23 [Planctomycetota bacterium]
MALEPVALQREVGRRVEPPVLIVRRFTARRVGVALLLAITAGAIAFRAPLLSMRPMHTDEAVQAVKFGQLYDQGYYKYDPYEYHGPTLNFVTLPFVWLSNPAEHSFATTSETAYRVVPVVFGIGTLLLMFLAAEALGWPAAVIAGLLLAISPAFVFYNRYYIHESLFVFFTFLFLIALWQSLRSKKLGWVLLAGAAAGLMHATKETSIITFTAVGCGLVGITLWRRYGPWVPSEDRRPLKLPPLKPWGYAALVALAVIFVTYSSFFMYPADPEHPRSFFGRLMEGPLDAIRCYTRYFNRGVGNESHVHPWYFYLNILLYFRNAPGPYFTEALIVVLSIAGIVVAITGWALSGERLWIARFLAIYTVALTFAYSMIPYKTPWCMLSFLFGMILLAGIGAVVLVQNMPRWWLKAPACLVLLIAAGHLTKQSYISNYKFHADPRNPYVYSHTCGDINNLSKRVEDIAAVSSDGDKMLIKVVSSEHYPLPWYLRRFPNIGYWRQPPENADAPVVIASRDVDDDLTSKMKSKYHTEYFGLRHGFPVLVYVKQELWDEFMRRRTASVVSSQ